MKRIRAMLAAMTALTIASPMVLSAFAETINSEDPTVLVDVIVSGKNKIGPTKVPFRDADGNGTLTVNDVIIAAHDELFSGGAEAGYRTEMTAEGEKIVKLWGVENGSYGCMLNDRPIFALSDSVSEDAYLCFYVCQDTETASDIYTYFDVKRMYDDKTYDKWYSYDSVIPLHMEALMPDENGMLRPEPVEGAVITLSGDRTEYVTDQYGNVEVGFDLDHLFYQFISAEWDGMTIVPPAAFFYIYDPDDPTFLPETTTTTTTGIFTPSELYFEDTIYTDLYPGEGTGLYVRGYFDDLEEYFPGLNPLSYSVENEDVIQIEEFMDEYVCIRAIAPGTSKVFVTAPDGRTAETTVTVHEEEFRFTQREAWAWVGEDAQIEIHGGEDAVFSVADEDFIDIISTDNGTLVFTPLQPGDTVITATQVNGGASAQIVLHIGGGYETEPFGSPYHLSADCQTVCVGETATVMACGNVDSFFEIEDESVAEIVFAEHGTVTYKGVAPGETRLIATCGEFTATVQITVVDPATTTTVTTVTEPFDGTTFTTTTNEFFTTDFIVTTTDVTTVTGSDFYYFVPPLDDTICVGEIGCLGIVAGIESNFVAETEGVIEVLDTHHGIITFKGIAPGETVITAYSLDGCYSTTATVRVLDPAVTTTVVTTTAFPYVPTDITTGTTTVTSADSPMDMISLDPSNATIEVGDELTLTVHGYADDNEYAPGDSPITFWLQNYSIATRVQVQGLSVTIKALEPGSLIVYALTPDDRVTLAVVNIVESSVPETTEPGEDMLTTTTSTTTTTTMISSTTLLTTVTEAIGTTTVPDGYDIPFEGLPQTGNNDITGLLVLIGTFALTGTGLTVLRHSGVLKDEEE